MISKSQQLEQLRRDPKFLHLAAFILRNLPQNSSSIRVLETGCGDGHYSLCLPQHLSQVCEWHGVDPNRALLDTASSYIPISHKLDAAANLTRAAPCVFKFHRGVAGCLPFRRKNEFHLVIFTNSLHFTGDCHQSITEAREMMTSDGLLLVVEPSEEAASDPQKRRALAMTRDTLRSTKLLLLKDEQQTQEESWYALEAHTQAVGLLQKLVGNIRGDNSTEVAARAGVAIGFIAEPSDAVPSHRPDTSNSLRTCVCAHKNRKKNQKKNRSRCQHCRRGQALDGVRDVNDPAKKLVNGHASKVSSDDTRTHNSSTQIVDDGSHEPSLVFPHALMLSAARQVTNTVHMTVCNGLVTDSDDE